MAGLVSMFVDRRPDRSCLAALLSWVLVLSLRLPAGLLPVAAVGRGYLESVKHLREMLMAYEWHLHGKELAERR